MSYLFNYWILQKLQLPLIRFHMGGFAPNLLTVELEVHTLLTSINVFLTGRTQRVTA